MSKLKRWRSLGKRWIMPNGTLVTSPFAGAKTVEDVGRIMAKNKSKAVRWRISILHPITQQRLRKLSKRCMGREFYRKHI